MCAVGIGEVGGHQENSQGSDDGTVVTYPKIAWNSKWEETLFHKEIVQWGISFSHPMS